MASSRRGFFLVLLALGCTAPVGAPAFVPYVPEAGTPEAVAYEAGLTSYLGHTRVVSSTTIPRSTGTVHELDPAGGPICMRGDPYRVSTREGTSDELVIFLQGGGACWSAFCFAITTAPGAIPSTDLLTTDATTNPLAGDDLLYLPYCDGSLFAGDAEIDEDGDGTPDRIHHGLANLSAALDVGYAHFPHPSRIVLAGSSGGGFGTILAVFLVRYVYPDVPIVVIDDAGVGVAHPENPSFVSDLLDEFGARRFVPDDCPTCIADGNVTGLVDYALDHDPNLRIGVITAEYDYVISHVFLGLAPDVFRSDVIAATDPIQAAHPDTYRRFVFLGDAHTATLGSLTGLVGTDLGHVELPPDSATLLANIQLESTHTASSRGVLLDTWLRAFLAGDLEGAADLVDGPGPLPDWATTP